MFPILPPVAQTVGELGPGAVAEGISPPSTDDRLAASEVFSENGEVEVELELVHGEITLEDSQNGQLDDGRMTYFSWRRNARRAGTEEGTVTVTSVVRGNFIVYVVVCSGIKLVHVLV